MNVIVKNFTSDDELVRVQAIKLMSLLLSDQNLHEIAYTISDF